MGASSATGVGSGSADGFNRGSVHQTLGYGHLIDDPIFTEFPPLFQWNKISSGGDTTRTIQTFWFGIFGGPFYVFKQGFVRADILTQESELTYTGDPDLFASFGFDTVENLNNAPFPYRIITAVTTSAEGQGVFSWTWNNRSFWAIVHVPN